MNFYDLVKKRSSVRSYSVKPVELEKIERCIESVRLAPSACNSQPWKFIIITDPHIKNNVAQESYGKLISFNKFAEQAPVIVAVISEPAKLTAQIGGLITDKNFYLIDIGIAAEHFCLQASEEGLGTCMLGWFNENKVKKILKVPKNKRVILLITLGYPVNDKIISKNRKNIKEIYCFNEYKN
ncbi:nitroreductase family protein [Candidatus Dependentiae bacterium]|nr:nitroreductase family protein [Candidatus Dependentiae bacterium]